MITAIVFDVDDTLYDQQAAFQLAISANFAILKEELAPLYLRFRHHSDAQFEKSVSGEWSLDQMRVYRIQAAMRDFGYKISEADARKFQADYERAQNDIQLPKEISALLNQADGRYKLAVITNGPAEHQQRKIRQLALQHWIPKEAMFISGAVGSAKPEIDIFRAAEEYLNVPAEEILYIGDSFENDVEGAKNAGWQVWWFNHRQRDVPVPHQYLPDATLDSFPNLLTYFKEHL